MRGSSALAAALCFAVTGCGGGGSASVAPPPGAAPNGTGPTTFAVTSVPAGLAVTIAGDATQSARTPTTVVPGRSNRATTITIAPSNGRPPYVFVGDQRADGDHTVLYDQSADTSGSLASVAATSTRRAATAYRAAPDLPRRAVRGSRGLPQVSATRLVVRYRASLLRASGTRARDLERDAGIATGRDFAVATGALATRIVDVAPGADAAAVARRLRARPEVASAEPERLYHTDARTAVTPNDTHFNATDQWSLFDVSAPGAWGYTSGSPGVAIAIVDTGLDFHHADFAGGKVTYAEKIVGGVTTAGIAAAQDTDGHGTNVAGIAAADTNNAFGIAGVGYGTSLQIYRVFSDGTAADGYKSTAESADVTQAIYDAVGHGAKVINLSLGTCQALGADTLQRDAVTYAIAHGVSVVAASGNDRTGGTDSGCTTASSTVEFPAAFDGAIAVGATKLDDAAAPGVFALAKESVASYSESGPGLALVAPGGDPGGANDDDLLHWIFGLSTTTGADPSLRCTRPADCVALFAGTSQAAPHVAGVAALMLAVDPTLTPARIKTILMRTADDIGDVNQGAGRLNAYRALAAASGDPLPPRLPTPANFVAFAYVPAAGNVPKILDVTYPAGVPVASDGTFRIADIPPGATGYRIGVWSDANGDGIVDAGDSFGASPATCSAGAPCASAAGIVARPVAAGFVLP